MSLPRVAVPRRTARYGSAGDTDGQIKPTSVPGEEHRAGGFTKPLAEDAYRAFAAENLGLDTNDLVIPGSTQATAGA